MACLPELVAAQAARTPDAMAVVADEGRLTYAELMSRANRLARHLRGLGVTTDTPVGVLLERGLDLVVALVGVQVAGGAYLPLDPSLPVERLRFMLADVAASALVTGRPCELPARALVGARPAAGGQALVDVTSVDLDSSVLDGVDDRPLPALSMSGSLAYVLFTSGSTGRPKGVCVPHRGIVNRLLWMQQEYGLDGSDVVLQKTPFGFDVSVWEFFWPLITGARLVMALPAGHQEPAYLASVIAEHGVTTLHFVPTMLASFLAWCDATAGGTPDLGTARRVICSGEPLAASLAAKAGAIFGCGVHNLYGPTEASVDVSFHEWTPADTGPSVPIGAAITGVTLHVLDDALRPVDEGELHIGGVALARGYHGRPGLTAERFIPDPFGAGGRLYRTGDLVRRLPSGELEFLRRLDDQVKLRGQRIEPGEIEHALLDLPGITAAAVAIHDGRLVAYVVGSGPLDALSSRLPSAMIPQVYVRLPQLPTTPSGKTDRSALPVPTVSAVGTRTEPATTTEQALLPVWQELFGDHHLDADFLAAGGDSILAVRLVAGARRQGLALTVRHVFTYRTLEALARVAVPADELVLPALRVDLPSWEGVADAYPLTPLQEGMLFHWLHEPSGYLQHHVYALAGGYEVERLAAAWRTVLSRHPALRTTIAFEGVPDPVQVVWRSVAHDVAVAPSLDDRRGGFDITAAPPIRVTLVPAGDGLTIAVTYHHILLDGWSLAVVLDEVFRAYAGEPLPPVAEFRRYVAWRSTVSPTPTYWTTLLAGAPARPSLATTRTTPAQLARELPPSLADWIRIRAATAEVTLQTVFAAAWARTMASGDVVIGVTVAGRPPQLPGIESMVGLLINTIPLRVDTSSPDILRSVHEQQLASQAHEHDSLVDIARAAGVYGSDLFDSILVFQNHPPLPGALTTARIDESTGYPLTLIVELVGGLQVRLLHTLADTDATGLLDRLEQTLSRI